MNKGPHKTIDATEIQNCSHGKMGWKLRQNPEYPELFDRRCLECFYFIPCKIRKHEHEFEDKTSTGKEMIARFQRCKFCGKVKKGRIQIYKR